MHLMTDKASLKSAYELAMERLDQQDRQAGVERQVVSEAQSVRSKVQSGNFLGARKPLMTTAPQSVGPKSFGLHDVKPNPKFRGLLRASISVQWPKTACRFEASVGAADAVWQISLPTSVFETEASWRGLRAKVIVAEVQCAQPIPSANASRLRNRRLPVRVVGD